MSTIIKNTRNQTIATLANMELNTSTSLDLIGRGYAGFGQYIQGDLYRLMEHFASDTPPASPVEGQMWYAVTDQELSFYNGTSWVALATGNNVMGVMLSRMAGADAVDFATTGSVNVHTAATSTKSLVTSVLLVPRTGASVAGANVPAFALEVTSNAADVCDKVTMLGLTAATGFFFHNISGTNRMVAAGEVVKLNKKTAISGGDTLVCDAYLFGHILEV